MSGEETSGERSPSLPREVPTEWPEIAEDGLLEEEAFPWYTPEKWYSAQIGEVFESRYQVLRKLGFGSVSTAWLCRDLRAHKYVTMKVYETGHWQALNENKILHHLQAIESSHPGSKLVRLALDTFEVPGKEGPHVCIIHEPLSLSLTDIREMAGGKLPNSILKPVVHGILLALDYLHSVAHVVLTDVQEGNVMLSVTDQSIFDDLVAEEWASPNPRKSTGRRVVHTSTPLEMPDDPGVPIITDSGDAKIGSGPFLGEVMPDLYRAPEIILGIPWDAKIDIWALGLMIWDMYEGKHLFNRRLPSREASVATHLARMNALLGPPPSDVLTNGSMVSQYFDENGTLKQSDVALETSLELEEENLEGEDKAAFLTFIRKMLWWRPADRLPARELIRDPWLQKK